MDNKQKQDLLLKYAEDDEDGSEFEEEEWPDEEEQQQKEGRKKNKQQKEEIIEEETDKPTEETTKKQLDERKIVPEGKVARKLPTIDVTKKEEGNSKENGKKTPSSVILAGSRTPKAKKTTPTPPTTNTTTKKTQKSPKPTEETETEVAAIKPQKDKGEKEDKKKEEEKKMKRREKREGSGLRRESHRNKREGKISLTSSSSKKKKKKKKKKMVTLGNGSTLVFEEQLGTGGYGEVYRAFHRKLGYYVAVKRIRLHECTKDQRQHYIQEINLLKKLEHSNIIRYIDHKIEKKRMYIVMEQAEGSLKFFGDIWKEGTTDIDEREAVVSRYTRQILEGLNYLHQEGVIHRDIKGANLLLKDGGIVKLADFGVSVQKEEATTGKAVGSSYWMAPEVIQERPATTKVDIWSVGCTVIEILTGRPPYYNLELVSAAYHMVSNDHPPLPTKISPLCRNFLRKCFTKDVTRRPSAQQLLNDPFILKFNSPNTVPTKEQPKKVTLTEKERAALEEKNRRLRKYQETQEEEEDDLFSDDQHESLRVNPSLIDRHPKKILFEDRGFDDDEEEDDLDFGGDEDVNLTDVLSKKYGDKSNEEPTQFEDIEQEFNDIDMEEHGQETYQVDIKQLIEQLNDIHALDKVVLSDIASTLIEEMQANQRLYSLIPQYHGVLPIVDMLHHADVEIQLAYMQLINSIIEANMSSNIERRRNQRLQDMYVAPPLDFHERLCIVGGLHEIHKYAQLTYPFELRHQAITALKFICNDRKTLGIFVSSTGLPVLVDFLKFSNFEKERPIIVETICIFKNMFSPSKFRETQYPKYDFCRLLARPNVNMMDTLLPVIQQLLNEDNEEATELLHFIVEIILLFSKAGRAVKQYLSEVPVLTALMDFFPKLARQSRLLMLQAVKELSSDPITIHNIESTSTVAVLVTLLDQRDSEATKHALNTLHQLCRISQNIRDAAVTAGIIPLLQSILESTSHPFRHLAIDIFCDLAHTNEHTRLALVQSNSLPFYLQLFSDGKYAYDNALNSLYIILKDEATFKATQNFLCERDHVKLIRHVCRHLNHTQFAQITTTLRVMIQRSIRLNKLLSTTKFDLIVLHQLTHMGDAMIFVEQMQILQHLFKHTDHPKQLAANAHTITQQIAHNKAQHKGYPKIATNIAMKLLHAFNETLKF